MGVRVDEAGRYGFACGVDDRLRRFLREGSNGCNLSVLDGDIRRVGCGAGTIAYTSALD